MGVGELVAWGDQALFSAISCPHRPLLGALVKPTGKPHRPALCGASVTSEPFLTHAWEIRMTVSIIQISKLRLRVT